MKVFHPVFKRTGRILFLGTVLVAPWLYGGVTPAGYVFLYLGIFFSAIAAFLTLWTTWPVHRRMNTLFAFWGGAVPLLLAILWGFIQLIPMSDSILSVLSPHIIEMRSLFTGSEDLVGGTGTRGHTMSIYPETTWEFVSFLCWLLSAYFSAGILFETKQAKRFLWRSVAVNGLVLALFCIFTRVNPEGIFYQRHWPGAHIGPYVNRNNAAGYLCLCLGTAVSFWVHQILLVFRSQREIDSEYDADFYQRSLRQKWREHFWNLIESFNGKVFLASGIVAVIVVAILSTLSRGGSLAMIFGLFVGVLVFFLRRGMVRFWYLFVLLLLVSGFFVVWTGMSERVSKRMETLTVADKENNPFQTDTRLANWSGALRTAQHYYGRGSGWGTWSLANRSEDQRVVSGTIFMHAENIFVETYIEGGFVGLAILFSGLLLYVLMTLSAFFRKNSSDDFAQVVGFCVILSAVLVASCFDFGIYLPANALLFAALAGSFFNIYRDESEKLVGELNVASVLQPVLKISELGTFFVLATLFLSIGSCFFGLQTARNSLELEQLLTKNGLPEKPWVDSYDQIAYSIAELSTIAAKKNNDVRLHLRLAEFQILKFRAKALEGLLNEQTDRAAANWWSSTEPILYLEKLCFHLKGGMTVAPRRIRNYLGVTQELTKALNELEHAKRCTPFFPELHIQHGLLFPLVHPLNYSEVLEVIKKDVSSACFVSRLDPMVQYQAGLLLYAASDLTSALPYWRESLRLRTDWRDAILICTLARLPDSGIESLVDSLFPEELSCNVGSWSRLKTLGAKSEKKERFQKALAERIERDLENVPEKERDGSYYRALVDWLKLTSGAPEKIRVAYESIMKQSPSSAELFHEYGSWLLDQNDVDQAVLYLGKASLAEPKKKSWRDLYERAEFRKQHRQSRGSEK